MSCELTGSVLHGYLDGELDAARAADFERHLVSCPECVRSLEEQENLRSSLNRAALYEPAPRALRDKLYAEFGASALARSASRNVPAVHSLPWRALAIAATILLAISLGWQIVPRFLKTGGEPEFAAALVDAHLRSLQPGHLEDVISTDQHTVKPWFDGKIDFAPSVRDFTDQGFPLQGGRLDAVRGRTVAVLVYGRRKHIINVFVWPTREADSQPVTGSQLGYNWVDWRKNGMEMCAVSDVNAGDLSELEGLLSQ